MDNTNKKTLNNNTTIQFGPGIATTKTQRIAIANDANSIVFASPQAVTLAALPDYVTTPTFNIGTTPTIPVSITALPVEAGLLTYRNTALTNTPVSIKATPGSIRGWNFVNVNTTPVYIKFYDLVSPTVGSSVVTRTVAIPPGSAINPAIFFLEAQSTSQEDFITAISMACVTGLADTSNTPPTIPIHSSVRYK